MQTRTQSQTVMRRPLTAFKSIRENFFSLPSNRLLLVTKLFISFVASPLGARNYRNFKTINESHRELCVKLFLLCRKRRTWSRRFENQNRKEELRHWGMIVEARHWREVAGKGKRGKQTKYASHFSIELFCSLFGSQTKRASEWSDGEWGGRRLGAGKPKIENISTK